jgi:hypothetical protein
MPCFFDESSLGTTGDFRGNDNCQEGLDKCRRDLTSVDQVGAELVLLPVIGARVVQQILSHTERGQTGPLVSGGLQKAGILICE